MVDTHSDANQLIEDELDAHLRKVQDILKSDAIVYDGPVFDGLESKIKNALEKIRGDKKQKSPRLSFIIQTNGGSISAVERIANAIRSHYNKVDFIVPDYAMSAGTVLAMSGDDIYMDYFSVLGPIDPQVYIDGHWVPALGYIEKYNELINKDADSGLATAELMYLVQRFNPADLYNYEQAKELSITLLKEWLVKFKFRNWKETETQKQQVTHAMKVQRAEEIATKLNDTSMWHSHSRGISMQVLKNKLKLKINDYGEIPVLKETIKDYTTLLEDFNGKLGTKAILHYPSKFKPFW